MFCKKLFEIFPFGVVNKWRLMYFEIFNSPLFFAGIYLFPFIRLSKHFKNSNLNPTWNEKETWRWQRRGRLEEIMFCSDFIYKFSNSREVATFSVLPCYWLSPLEWGETSSFLMTFWHSTFLGKFLLTFSAFRFLEHALKLQSDCLWGVSSSSPLFFVVNKIVLRHAPHTQSSSNHATLFVEIFL